MPRPPRAPGSSTTLVRVEDVSILVWPPPAALAPSDCPPEGPDSVSLAEPNRAVPRRRDHPVAKRIMDLVVASVLLVVTLPIVLAGMLAVRLTSPGPVVFVQWRLGKDRVPFRCYKLRTMVQGAERLLRDDSALQADFFASWKLHRDPRVTPVGSFLRRTSIDELPQLVNVLRGEMSMVGPRPVQLPEARQLYGVQTAMVLRHKPGLTGMWQVSGRSSTPYHERAELDLRYAVSQSFWLDVTLLIQTIPAVLSMRDAV